jgi:hypothetical protein
MRKEERMRKAAEDSQKRREEARKKAGDGGADERSRRGFSGSAGALEVAAATAAVACDGPVNQGIVTHEDERQPVHESKHRYGRQESIDWWPIYEEIKLKKRRSGAEGS